MLPVKRRPGRPCPICIHPERQKIEESENLARPSGVIAREFAVRQKALHSHRKHFTYRPAGMAEVQGEVGEIVKLRRLVEPLARSPEPKVQLAALAQLAKLTELEARLGQQEQDQGKLVGLPAWELLRTQLLNIVGECERCQAALLALLPTGGTMRDA